MQGESEIHGRWGFGWLGIILLIIVVYVLSIGPVVGYANWVDFDFDIERFDKVFNTVYYPVVKLTDSFPILKSALNAYLEFWTETVFGVDCW